MKESEKSESIELTEEESKQIAEMMQDDPQPRKSEEQINAEAGMEQAFKEMKKLLKRRSKSALIGIIWTYGIQLQQMQHACQVLLEENKELKGEPAKGEESND